MGQLNTEKIYRQRYKPLKYKDHCEMTTQWQNFLKVWIHIFILKYFILIMEVYFYYKWIIITVPWSEEQDQISLTSTDHLIILDALSRLMIKSTLVKSLDQVTVLTVARCTLSKLTKIPWKHHFSSDFELAQMTKVQSQDIFSDHMQFLCQVCASNRYPLQDMS